MLNVLVVEKMLKQQTVTGSYSIWSEQLVGSELSSNTSEGMTLFSGLENAGYEVGVKYCSNSYLFIYYTHIFSLERVCYYWEIKTEKHYKGLELFSNKLEWVVYALKRTDIINIMYNHCEALFYVVLTVFLIHT